MNKNFRTHVISINSRRVLLYSLAGAVLVFCLIAFAYWAVRGIELQTIKQGEVRGNLEGRFSELRTVNYNGSTYQYRNGLTTILLMGIDKDDSFSAYPTGMRNGGQADFLMLLVIDANRKTITPIQIDRDTMSQITILGVLGNEAGTRTAQICLSHGFGDGKDQSCKLTQDAVSKLLLGAEIDFYVAVNMNAISAINDLLGGVTVTLQDDFTTLDPTMTKGRTLTLMGEQAEYYVRQRLGIGIGTNEARMARQREYVQSVLDKMEAKIVDDKVFMDNLLDNLGEGLLTNMKRGRMINEFYGSKDYIECDIITPNGNRMVGKDGFMEFHADEKALETLVITTFFAQQPAT